MSLWLHRKDPEGRTHYIASSAIVLLAIPILGILIAAILPLVQSCRVWFRG